MPGDLRKALEGAERVFFFDLSRMREIGPDYNQAVVDAGNRVREALASPASPPLITEKMEERGAREMIRRFGSDFDDIDEERRAIACDDARAIILAALALPEGNIHEKG